MRMWIAGSLLAWAPYVAIAETPIEDVIGAQMQAFLSGDVETAFGFASPTIQGMFGSPQRFGVMVEQGYPMVWRPDEYRFLDRREIAGRIWQKVLVRDAAGVVHILDYQMQNLDGEWRINGVQILPAQQEGA